MRTLRARPGADLLIAVLFAAMLLAPAVAYALGAGRDNAQFIARSERREPAPMPPAPGLAADSPRYTRALERVIADAFPLRTALIQGYDVTKFVLLGDSSSDQVLRGRDGWLFLGDREQRAYITGALHVPEIQIDYLTAVFAARAAFCRAHGTRYVVMFAPDKSTIYPEELPDAVRLAHPTILERLVPRLRAAGVEVVDVTPALLEAKRSGEVYAKGDTHWNARGAYAAYRVLVDRLRSSGARPFPPASFAEHPMWQDGDLLRMSGVALVVRDRYIDASIEQRARRVPVPQYAEPIPDANEQPYATVRDDASLPTAVMFGDSFGGALRPLVSESFRRIVHVYYGTQPFNEHLVAAEHPNVVIQELVERALGSEVEQ